MPDPPSELASLLDPHSPRGAGSNGGISDSALGRSQAFINLQNLLFPDLNSSNKKQGATRLKNLKPRNGSSDDNILHQQNQLESSGDCKSSASDKEVLEHDVSINVDNYPV